VPLELAQSLEGFRVAVVNGGDDTVVKVVKIFVPLNNISLHRENLNLNTLPRSHRFGQGSGVMVLSSGE
jgi:hypothetical protein